MVTANVNLRHDWKFWANRENAVVRSRRTVSGRTDWAVHTASIKRRALQWKDLAGGIYTPQDLVWCVPAELVEPIGGMKISDVIEDPLDDVQWIVIDCSHNTHRSWFRCVCRDLVLAYDLRDSLDIWAPTNAADASGHRAPTFAALHSRIPGRLQPIEATEVNEFGKLALAKSYTAFLASQLTVAQQLAITNEMQVRINGNTTAYQVKAWRNPARIDQLFEIDVEIMP